MTGREKILQAFEPSGTPEVGVVACYDDIFIRDHWFSLTEIPWWYAGSGVVEKEIAWAGDVSKKAGLEWLTVRPCASRAERSRQRYERREDGMWSVDKETGSQRHLPEPTPSGTNTNCASSIHRDLDALPATENDVDTLIPLAEPFDRSLFLKEGRHDAAVAIRSALDVLLYRHISSPLWSLYGLLGYEGMMVFLLQDRNLASYAGERILENTRQDIRMIAALGADAVWIEECLTDQISPEIFAALNVPILRDCVKEIRDRELKSIYYYCGNPYDRLDAILDVGADALHFEESKKDFTVDVEDIVKRVQGRCVVFGNLDAINVLPNAAEEALRSDIERQLAAGTMNGRRFVMSTGSPITPDTPVERVKLYADLVREFGSR
jgi:hypothetical protein